MGKFYMIDAGQLAALTRISRRLHTEDRMSGDEMRDFGHQIEAIVRVASDLEIPEDSQAPAESTGGAFALKCWTGPAFVKQYADKLRAIAGFDSVSEGTEYVYFTMSGEPSHDAARERAQGMIKFSGIKGLTVCKV